MSATKNLSVPFLDIRAQNRNIWPELQEALDEVIPQAQFILGPAVERFEVAFAQYIGTKFCVGLNSGTSALHMALQASDIGQGDEVITTSHTWISTSWAISYVGATPVYSQLDAVTILEQIQGAMAYLDSVGTRAEDQIYKKMRLVLEGAYRTLHQRMHARGMYHRHNPKTRHGKH